MRASELWVFVLMTAVDLLRDVVESWHRTLRLAVLLVLFLATVLLTPHVWP